MQTIHAQLVIIWWSKASRGMPQAQVRAGLPLAYPLDMADAHPAGTAAGLLHTVTRREEEGFAPHVEVRPLPIASPNHPKLSIGPLTLHPHASGARLHYVYGPSQGAPDRRGRPPIEIDVPAGRLAQLRVNGRFAGTSIPWLYKLSVVTVAVGIPLSPAIFLVEPDHLLDLTVELF